MRDRIYRFSRQLSGRLLFLAMYYSAFFFLFFLLADDLLFTIPEHPHIARLLSAVAMGALFTGMHAYIFRKRK
jgi:hypothetical protein